MVIDGLKESSNIVLSVSRRVTLPVLLTQTALPALLALSAIPRSQEPPHYKFNSWVYIFIYIETLLELLLKKITLNVFIKT